MSSVLLRSSRRYLSRHPWISALSVTGVALGVGVVVAIDLAGRSATTSFELASEAITGRATHQIIGGPAGVPDELYVELRRRHGVRRAAPVVEGPVLVGEGRRPMTLLGVDPLAERPFRGYAASVVGPEGDLGAFVGRRAALLAEATARSLDVEIGDTVTVVAAGLERRLRVIGALTSDDELATASFENLLLVDVSTAQEMLGLEGALTRIDLGYPEETGGAARRATPDRDPATLASLLPPGVRLERASRRSETAEELTRAFRLNLFMLSLLALVCGGFLIYNSVTFSVVVRRSVFGTLRALGLTRAQLLRLVLLEAVAVGAVGSLLGIGLGRLLARGLVGMVAQTISDHYFSVSVSEPATDPTSLGVGLALGLGTAAVAGLRPAWEASAASPRRALVRSELESWTRRRTSLAALAGAGAILAGAIALWAFRSALWPSFVAVLAVLVGAALLTPAAVRALGLLLAAPLGRLVGPFGRMAARGLVAQLSRTGVAIAALTLALAVTIGIGLMITSFRTTVERWLGASLPADLYLISPERQGGATPADLVRDEWLDAIARLPEIERVNRLRRATVDSSVGPLELVALDMDERSHGAFALASGDEASAWEAYEAGRGALISEPLASRTGLAVGSVVELTTPRGRERLPVEGVFYDYSSDRGYLLIELELYRSLWGDLGLTAASAFVRDAASLDTMGLEATADRVRAALPPTAALVVTTQRTLRERSLEVFDRTFRVTAVLRALTLIVAIIGILSALMAQQLERTRELGLLRASGVTRRQVWLMVTAQTGLVGLVAGVLALPVGIAMAAMTTLVINQRSFGWTIPLEVEPAILGQAVLAAVLAALAAGILPSLRMASTSPAEALRSE